MKMDLLDFTFSNFGFRFLQREHVTVRKVVLAFPQDLSLAQRVCHSKIKKAEKKDIPEST
jgi:hypothetical protein